MTRDLSAIEYHESLREFLNSPIPGEMTFANDEEALRAGIVMDSARFTHHDALQAVIVGEGADPLEIPAPFRADSILILASMLGSGLGGSHLSDDEVITADRLIFSGGSTHWIGLEIDTKPLFDEFLETKIGNHVESGELAEYIGQTIEGAQPPSLVDVDKQAFLDRADTTTASLGAKLLLRLLKNDPSDKLKGADLELLIEHYEATGQVLLGTQDQFVAEGDIERGSMAFWLLQLAEAEQQPISQTTNPDHSQVVKFYKDGSRRTEIYTAHNHRAKIIYETSRPVVDFADRRAEKPMLSIVAGYEQYKKIPYLPDWMKDSEAAEYPTTVLLDVYPDRYILSVMN